jgi:hypothetical protein
MRIKIEKTKKKGQSCILLSKKGNRRRGKGMTTDDNLDIKRCYTLYHVEKDMVVYRKKGQKIKFGYQVVSHVPLEWHGHHSCSNNSFY